MESGDTYNDQRAAAIDGRVVGAKHFEASLVGRGQINGHGYKITDDQHLKYPRENGKEERAHYVAHSPVDIKVQDQSESKTKGKMNNVLAALSDESDGYADPVAEEDESNKNDDG